MTTQTPPPAVRYRFTADQYEEMIRTGILTKDDRVELIDGEVVAMPPIGPDHSTGVALIADALYHHFRDVALVWSQLPVRLNDRSDPQPDLALIRRRGTAYRAGYPRAEDILLIIEISDTTFAYDRRTKALIYARGGLLEYWIHDVRRDTLIVLRDPSPDGYRSEQTLRRGDRIAPLAFPERELAVTDLLGDA